MTEEDGPRIRDAAEADVEAVVGLWRELMDFHAERDPCYRRGKEGDLRFAEWLRAHLEKEDGLLLVAEGGGRLLGYLLGAVLELPPVFDDRPYGMIFDLAVTGPERRRGVGRALLERAVGWFRQKGLRRVECNVACRNEIARGFWRKQGFEPYFERLRREVG